MARDFSALTPRPYAATPQAVNINQPPSGQARGPITVPLTINWTSYGASAANSPRGVNVDLGQSRPGGTVIDRILAVYIDNTNSVSPIYIFFPDTGFMVTQQPYSAAWQNVITNGLLFTIIVDDVVDGLIPLTRVFVQNQCVNPFSDIEVPAVYPRYLATPTAASIVTPEYVPIALGDVIQADFAQWGASPAQLNVPLWGCPRASGFIYFVALSLDYIRPTAVAGASELTTIIDEAGGQTIFTSKISLQSILRSILLSQSGFQIRLDATLSWRLRTTISGVHPGNTAWMNYFFAYTFTPTGGF